MLVMDRWVRIALGLCIALVVGVAVATVGSGLSGDSAGSSATSFAGLVWNVLALLLGWALVLAAARFASSVRQDGRWGRLGYGITLTGLLLLGALWTLLVAGGVLQTGVEVIVRDPIVWASVGVLALGAVVMTASRAYRAGTHSS
jgi:hypothetical protein